MSYRPYIRLLFIIGWLFTGFRGYNQTVNPTCTNHFYKGSYELEGSISMKSLVIGPDGCMYIGCGNGYDYGIIKLDSRGDSIRCRTYVTPAFSAFYSKTIWDIDGNLFSYANGYVLRTD